MIPAEPMGFTGKEADEEVGLVYFGERYLMPHLGRWASPDPLHVHANGGGEFGNSYHYVAGNLLQGRDPIGLEDDNPCVSVGACYSTSTETRLAQQLTTEREGGYRRDGLTLTPHHPSWGGGRSGVTIGAGYDMRTRTAAQIRADMLAIGMDEDTADRLAGAAGLTHRDADRFARDNTDIAITQGEQEALLNRVYHEYERRAVQRLVDTTPTTPTNGYVPMARWEAFDWSIRAIATDLAFNSGQLADHRAATVRGILNDTSLDDVGRLRELRNFVGQLPGGQEGVRVRQGFIDRQIDRMNADGPTSDLDSSIGPQDPTAPTAPPQHLGQAASANEVQPAQGSTPNGTQP